MNVKQYITEVEKMLKYAKEQKKKGKYRVEAKLIVKDGWKGEYEWW